MMLAGLPVPTTRSRDSPNSSGPPAPTTWADRLDRAAPTCSDLGLERRAVDAICRALPVIVARGYARLLVRVGDYLGLRERSIYDGTRVR